MPARWKAVDFVKRLAKGPLAYLKRSAQGRNVQWLVYMGEGQSLSLFDEIAARVAFPSERRFRNDCEPLMNVHQKTPVERARQIGFTGHTTRQVLGRYCPLGQPKVFGPRSSNARSVQEKAAAHLDYLEPRTGRRLTLRRGCVQPDANNAHVIGRLGSELQEFFRMQDSSE